MGVEDLHRALAFWTRALDYVPERITASVPLRSGVARYTVATDGAPRLDGRFARDLEEVAVHPTVVGNQRHVVEWRTAALPEDDAGYRALSPNRNS